jgi:hypothetical protein
MPDSYNCPRPESTGTMPRLAVPPPAPAAETQPTLPPPPADTSYSTPPSRARLVNRAARYSQTNRPAERQPASQIQAESARYTSFAETIETDPELDEAEPAGGETLESQMEAEDAELDGAEEIPGPDVLE